MKKKTADYLLTLAYHLKTKVPDNNFNMSFLWNEDRDCGCALGWACNIFGEDKTNKHLNVDTHDFVKLYGSKHERTPKQEAKIIEDYVKEHGYIYG